jgi:prepilin-type processing-associated H-X9-DG protein
MVRLFLSRDAAGGDMCQINALKKSGPNAIPIFFDCSLLSFALYDRYLQTAKNPQQIKTELHILFADGHLRRAPV